MTENMQQSNHLIRLLDELSQHVQLRLNYCSDEFHSANWLEKQAHLDYDIWLVLTGDISIQMKGWSETASPGDFIFFSPDSPYMASSADGCSFIYCHFDFSVGNYGRILDDLKLDGVIPSTYAKEEFQLMCEVFHSYKLNTPLSAIRLKSCLTLLLTKIIQSYSPSVNTKNANHQSKEIIQPQSARNFEFLQPVFHFIHNGIHKPITIRELAQTAGMSEKYFITFFKKTVGVTPGQYIYQHRMNRARDYLYERKYSIREIAERLGYPDPYSFSKAFKKQYKVPPSKFV